MSIARCSRSTASPSMNDIWSESRPVVRAGARTTGYRVPSMDDGPEVKVLSELGRRDRSEPQGADREGSAERSGVANPSSRRTETG
jgi:hypothetical protein